MGTLLVIGFFILILFLSQISGPTPLSDKEKKEQEDMWNKRHGY